MKVQVTTTVQWVSPLQLSAHLQIEGNALKLAFSSGVFKSSQRCGGCARDGDRWLLLRVHMEALCESKWIGTVSCSSTAN